MVQCRSQSEDLCLLSREVISAIRYFCVFAGYPRSGHSFIGSIIDAHPHMILGDEVGAQVLAAAGYDRQYIFEQLLARSRQSARTPIESPWVGGYERLEVIGDKPSPPLAWEALSYTVVQNWDAVEILLATVGVPTKFVHVVRNPYDNITSLFRNEWAESLWAAIRLYFDTFDKYMELKSLVEPLWFDVRLKDIIADSRAFVVNLCRFLEQEPVVEYVDACVDAIWSKRRIRRFEVEWPEHLVAYVADRISEREVLRGYVYDWTGPLDMG